MKANEVPEKIYINGFKPVNGFSGFTTVPVKEGIEYIRTDAFIEKACSILKDISCQFEIIEQFKNRIR